MKNEWPKLPKAFKKKWVAALRSGKYKQGQHSLHNSGANTYCCLGVAYKIVGYTNKKLIGQAQLDVDKDYRKVPAVLREKCEAENDLTSKLIDMNDSDRTSFKRIANWIEKNL